MIKDTNTLNALLIDKGWYTELDKNQATFANTVNDTNGVFNPENISKYISLDELNEFTRRKLAEKNNDPSDYHNYKTTQQLANLNIEQMIEDRDIGGAIYNTSLGKILELECDSDTYILAIKWYINLDTKEGIID